ARELARHRTSYWRLPLSPLEGAPHEEDPEEETAQPEDHGQKECDEPAEHGHRDQYPAQHGEDHRERDPQKAERYGVRGMVANEAVLLLEEKEEDPCDGSQEIGERAGHVGR